MNIRTEQNFSDTFLFLTQEGFLFRKSLTIGLTELRGANLTDKGRVYVGLFNLSTGLERLFKVIIVMDHMIRNNQNVPSNAELKKLSHSLNEQYLNIVNLFQHYDLKPPASLDKISQDILNLLNDFSKGSRYYNLDVLSGIKTNTDPLSSWKEIVDAVIDKDVSKKTKIKHQEASRAISGAIESSTSVLLYGYGQQPLSIQDALLDPSLESEAAKFIIYRLIMFLSPVKDLVDKISGYAYSAHRLPFPQMQEFLDWVWDDKAHVLRKKRWP